MLKVLSAVTLLAITVTVFAQSTPIITPSETPSVTPSQTPSVTPSQTPSVTPSQTPIVTPSQAPIVAPSQTPSIAIGGLSRCENLLGDEKDKCQKEERAGTGGSAAPHAPYSTMPATPPGSVR